MEHCNSHNVAYSLCIIDLFVVVESIDSTTVTIVTAIGTGSLSVIAAVPPLSWHRCLREASFAQIVACIIVTGSGKAVVESTIATMMR